MFRCSLVPVGSAIVGHVRSSTADAVLLGDVNCTFNGLVVIYSGTDVELEEKDSSSVCPSVCLANVDVSRGSACAADVCFLAEVSELPARDPHSTGERGSAQLYSSRMI